MFLKAQQDLGLIQSSECQKIMNELQTHHQQLKYTALEKTLKQQLSQEKSDWLQSFHLLDKLQSLNAELKYVKKYLAQFIQGEPDLYQNSGKKLQTRVDHASGVDTSNPEILLKDYQSLHKEIQAISPEAYNDKIYEQIMARDHKAHILSVYHQDFVNQQDAL